MNYRTITKLLAVPIAIMLMSGPLPRVLAADTEAIDQWDKKPEPAKQIASTSSAAVPLLKGQVTYCVPKGTPIKLKLASVPSFGLKMMQKDLDGNFYPAHLNDEITARTTEDLYVDDDKVLPQGTEFHGYVTRIFPPKRVGQPGSLVLTFDHFTTPDGRKFEFHIEANNKHDSTGKTKLRRFGWVAAHTAGGAVVGALVAYELCGLHNTIAMHGYNIAAGAGAGALMGTAVALLQHGKQAVLEPGDDINMEIDSDVFIPAATTPTPKRPLTNLPGLEIQVLKKKIKNDGLDGYQLMLDCLITNNTRTRLESIDLFVEDDNGQRYSVVADAEEDKTDMLFTIDPLSQQEIKCDFTISYPKLKHKLVWLEHGGSRAVIYEQKLP